MLQTEQDAKPAKRKASLPQRLIEALRSRTVTLTVPRSEDGYWTLIRYMNERGGFTADDLLRHVSDAEARAEIGHYLDACIRAGYVVPGKARGLLKVGRPQAEAPRLTRQGRERAHTTRQSHIWRAMKMLGYFTIRDLCVATATPGAEMPEAFAARYVEELAHAGYLISRPGPLGMTYRMRPTMNTGPGAPQVLRARFVWDPNLCRVVGDTRLEEVTR